MSDDDPTWAVTPGEALLDGLLAWEHLGTGGRCETWLAWDHARWVPVVVKLARRDHLDDARALRSLRREADVLGHTCHPGLPRLVVDGTRTTVPHVVVEHVDGPTLAELVDEEGPLDATETALLGSLLLTALAAVHRTGRAHCDLKPENVVVRAGRPVIVDLGSARRLGSPQPPGRPLGTPGYAAPEMERCEPVATGMDLYGAGATLAEALTDRMAADGPPGPEPFGLDPGDHGVAAVVAALLHPDAGRRPGWEEAHRRLVAFLDPAERPWPPTVDPFAAAAPAPVVRSGRTVLGPSSDGLRDPR